MPSLLTVEVLADALRPLIPEVDATTRLTLARTLVDLAAGTLGPEQARRTLSADPKLRAAYAALAGQEATAAGVPISFWGAPTGDVTTHPRAGGDAVTIGTLTVTLPPDDTPSPPRWWQNLSVHPVLLVLGVLLPVAGLVSVLADFGGARTQIVEWTAPFGIEAEQPGETLILIAPFERSEGVVDTRPHREIAAAIRDEAAALQLTTIRVAETSAPIAADDHGAAQQLGDRYDASIVIWGSDTGARVRVVFYNRKRPELEAAQVQIDETARSQLANPSAYAEFVTHDLPGQMTFLTFFGLGQAAYTATRYEEARTLIARAVSYLEDMQVPPDGAAEAFFRLGWLEQEPPAELDASIAAFTRAIELDADYARAYTNRGIAHQLQRNLPAALADYTMAIELEPTLALSYYNRGNAYVEQGALDLALADYTQTIQLDPAVAPAYASRGSIYLEWGELDKAEADFSRAIELDPTIAWGYASRGSIYLEWSELDKAEADLTRAIELDPTSAVVYDYRGFVYYRQGVYDQALVDLTKAIELDPTLVSAHITRGLVLRNKGVYDQALADLTKAIELNRTTPTQPDTEAWEAYYNRGNVYVDQGRLDLAIADYTTVIELDPTIASPYVDRGFIYFRQGAYEQALTDYTQAIALDPSFGLAYFGRGDVYAAQGDLDLAIADYTQALQRETLTAEVYLWRGVAYYHQGAYDQALADYTQAIELEPAHALAYYSRGLLHQARDQPELARQDYHRAIELADGNRDLIQEAQSRLAELESLPTQAP